MSIGSMPSGAPERNRPIQPSQAPASRTIPSEMAHTPPRAGSTRSDSPATAEAAALEKNSAAISGTNRFDVGSAKYCAAWLPGSALWWIQLAITKVIAAAMIASPLSATVARS